MPLPPQSGLPSTRDPFVSCDPYARAHFTHSPCWQLSVSALAGISCPAFVLFFFNTCQELAWHPLILVAGHQLWIFHQVKSIFVTRCLFGHITRFECNPLVIYSGQISAAHDGVLVICEVTLVGVQQETQQHRDKGTIAQPQLHRHPSTPTL